MWLTPAWQAAITIFGGIITVVVLPVMLDAKIPSTNYTIPQYTRDAMLIYWLAKVEPFNNSISEGTTDIPTTANFHHIASSDTAVSTTAPDVDSFEAAKLSVPEPFFDCTAPEADSFETAELPDEWFELRVQPSSDKEHHIFVLQLMHDILACLEVLPALGVYLIVFTTLSCIWLRWKAPKTKRAVSIHLDLVKALQNSTSSATPLIPPALLDVLEAASPDQQSLVDDTAALDPQLNGTPPPLLYEQGQTRFVKYRNVKAAKAQARRRRAVATPHRAAGAYDTCDPKLLDVTAQVEGHKKQSDSNFLDTTAIQGRLVNLEKSFKDLTTDKLSKDTQIAKLQDDQKNTSLKITEQSIEIKTLNKKLQDEVQDHRKLQTKLQVFSDKTDCWQQNVEGVLNQSHVDVTDEIKQVKFLIRHVETTLSKSLQDLQGAFTDVENRMGAFERDLKSLQGNVAGVGNRTEACEKGLNGLQDTFTGVETRTKAYEKRLNDLQGSIADVEHRTEVCEMSLNGLSPLQEAFVKAENKLETVEKQVAAIKTKDLPKIVNEQKVLRDRLNGVSAEVQRLTGAKPKKKRQRHRPRREEDPASDSGDEDGAGPGPGSQRTPSPASSKPDSQTPACDSSRDSINDKSSKSPPTSPDSTGTGPTEQSNRANDNSSDLAPESQESNGTGPKESPRPPASSPTSPPEDTPKEDPETGGNESGKDVPDSKGSSEPRTPRPTLREEPQAPFTEPKAAQNLTGDKCYDALGVQFDATPGRIRKAYKARASLVHPDKNKNDPGASHEAFVFLGEAYRVLSDLKEKKAYDRARINGTTYEPAPASDGFVPDTTPLPSAARPVDLEILGKVLEARISDRIWNLKKRPGAWKFSAMMLRPTALEELMKEDPDQPWPVC